MAPEPIELREAAAVMKAVDRFAETLGDTAYAADLPDWLDRLQDAAHRLRAVTVVRREPVTDPARALLIEELELPVRAYNALRHAGIKTIGDLVRRNEDELLAIPLFGAKSLLDVRVALQQRGLRLSRAWSTTTTDSPD